MRLLWRRQGAQGDCGSLLIYGHTHDILNPFIKELVERYL